MRQTCSPSGSAGSSASSRRGCAGRIMGSATSAPKPIWTSSLPGSPGGGPPWLRSKHSWAWGPAHSHHLQDAVWC